jgi:hypothetical protein
MIDAIVRKVKDLLVNPLEAFRKSREDATRSVIRYFLVLLLVDAVMTAIISLTGLGTWGMVWRVMHIHHPILVFFLVLVSGLILAPIFAAWLHLWVRVVGGRKGFSQTLKAVMYGATPGLLLGWIPFIGIIFHLWAMVLAIFGVHELHGIEGDRAAFAVIVAVIIPLVILVLFAAWFLIANVSTTLPAARAGIL